MILERKISRKIFGSTKDDITGVRRIRKNIELEVLYNEKNVIEIIKKARLRRVGHALRSRKQW